jgi:general secretion pathway protein G
MMQWRDIRNRARRAPKDDGFTLVEMLVVLGIIALLMALVAPQVMKYLGSAKSQTAAAQLKNIESAIELYYLDIGEYPSAEQGIAALSVQPAGLASWRGPYIKQKNGLRDPWGKDYTYRIPGEHGAFDLFSLGKDGAEGGEGESKDLVNW